MMTMSWFPEPHEPGSSGRGGQRDATARDSLADLPDIVVVPAHPAAVDGERQLVLEVREGADSRPVLPVFSSVERLALALGAAQPWVAYPLRTVQELAAAGRVSTVVLDPEVDPGAWRWRYDDLTTFQERQP